MSYVENNDTVCQCCLKTGSAEDNLRLIDENVESGGKTKKIYELFNTFGDDFGVFREFQEGSMICSDCFQQLVNANTFYQKCIQTRALIKMKQEMEVPLVTNIDVGKEELIRIPTPPIVIYDVEDDEVPRGGKISPIMFPANERGFQAVVPLVEKCAKEEQGATFRFECMKCDNKSSVFERQSDFLIHLSEKHDTPCILCETCGAVFGSIIEIDSHRLKHYIEIDSRHECIVCLAQFPSPQALQHHSVVHSNENTCHLCLKSFDHPNSLSSHLYQHVKHRVLACIYCPLQFRSGASLNDHIRENHVVRRFACDMENCSEKYFSLDQLRQHQGEKHDKSRGAYDCKVCKKVFGRKAELTDHLETHLNGNKFIPVHTTVNRVENKRVVTVKRNVYIKNSNKGICHHKNFNNQRNNNEQTKTTGNYIHRNNNNVQRNNFINNHGNNNNQQGVKKEVKRLWNNKGNVYSRLG